MCSQSFASRPSICKHYSIRWSSQIARLSHSDIASIRLVRDGLFHHVASYRITRKHHQYMSERASARGQTRPGIDGLSTGLLCRFASSQFATWHRPECLRPQSIECLGCASCDAQHGFRYGLFASGVSPINWRSKACMRTVSRRRGWQVKTPFRTTLVRDARVASVVDCAFGLTKSYLMTLASVAPGATPLTSRLAPVVVLVVATRVPPDPPKGSKLGDLAEMGTVIVVQRVLQIERRAPVQRGAAGKNLY